MLVDTPNCREILHLLGAISLGLALFIVASVTTTGAFQTSIYFAIQRKWLVFWPFRRGRGIPRFLRPLLKAFVPVWLQVEPGVRMLLDPADLISRVILETGKWDEATWLAIQRHLSDGSIFVDIGAHEGYCALQAVRAVGALGRVIAIEPNPEVVNRLQQNISASGAARINVIQAACYDTETILTLFSSSQYNTGSSSLSRENALLYGNSDRSSPVLARPLDNLVKEVGIPRLDVIKIDVEGAELHVLRGARCTLERFHPALLIELDDELLNAMGTSTSEVVEFLASESYVQFAKHDEANFEFRHR